jgi:beta-glucanase (GH16 family)
MRISIIFFILFYILAVPDYSETADLGKEPTFKEDFSTKRLSIFRWGVPDFTLYNFKSDPEMISNNNGLNYLKLGKSETDIYPSGFIYTKDHFSHGSYAVRMKVSDVPGAVASFFICSEIAKVFSDGTHDEIDFEFITAKPDSVLMTTWYLSTGMEGNQQTPAHNSFMWTDPSFDIREWHVYRFDWYQDRVDFFIDGNKIWTSTKAIPKRDMLIALHLYTYAQWDEVQFPPKDEVLQITDWVEVKEFKHDNQIHN